jgi:HEAT repeat protein
VVAQQIVASVVPVTSQWTCPADASIHTYLRMGISSSLSDRYTAVKALSYFSEVSAVQTLLNRLNDNKDHIYVRLEAASGLMRRGRPEGAAFIQAALRDPYPQHQLEAVIMLGEIGSDDALELLVAVLADTGQNPEIRAGAAWALGEVGKRAALPTLIDSFTDLSLGIKIEAARSLAKIARSHPSDLIAALPISTPEQRPGIAWALGKAGGFNVGQLLPAGVDLDSRQWLAYIMGMQSTESFVPEIESLLPEDPELYFAVTLLWKIIGSWVYGLEEY